RSVAERFTELLVEKVKACRVGNPLEEGIDVGPVIDEPAAIRIQSWVDEALSQGARLLCGGSRERAVVQPTVLTDTRPGMKVEDEEIFGPVLTVNAYDDFDEAVARCADSRYGLQGGIFTNDLRRAFRRSDEALSQGARLLCGGSRERAVVQPTVLTDTRPGMKVEDEEIFGPVLTVNAYDDFDEAVARCADSRYGLQGGIFTNDLRRAFR